MNYLLDTHALLWIISNDSRLSKKAKKVFLDERNSIFISMASLWEIAIKISLNKLTIKGSLREFINQHITDNEIKILNLSTSHLCLLENLPFKHRDPFDRLIICQSIDEKMSIITADKAIKKYKVDCIW